MSTIDNIEIFPIISLSIFVAFFLGLIWWVFKSDKKTYEAIAELPLNDKKD